MVISNSESMTIAGFTCPKCIGSMFKEPIKDIDTREESDQYICAQCSTRMEPGRKLIEAPTDKRQIARLGKGRRG